MEELPDTIHRYLERWFQKRYTMGYIQLDTEGLIRSWGGELDRLGVGILQAGQLLTEHLMFTEGLIPFDQPSIYLPMVTLDQNETFDIHLIRELDGYTALLIDASETKKQWSRYQQQLNELAIWKELQSTQGLRLSNDRGLDTLEDFFKACNTAALKLGPKGEFSQVGQAPDWLNRLFPEITGRRFNSSPENHFSFLDNFLLEAHDFWSRRKVGCIKSGIWIVMDESGLEHLLEAMAIYTGRYAMLLITQDNSILAEKQTFIQKAREMALGRDTLAKSQNRLQQAYENLEARFKERRESAEKTEERLEAEVVHRHQLEKERTIMLSQLQQAQKMEAIGTLAGGIAHDFNNILSAVVGFTELSLFDAPRESPLAHNLKQVISATQRAKALIRQILTFSRQSRPETRPVKLITVVREALTLLRASLPATVDIRRILRSQAYVMADPSQIDQVVMNLCTNAGHAMMDEGGILEIELCDKKVIDQTANEFQGLAPGSYVEMIVKDNGSGMTSETMSRIFDPFFTTKEKGEGTGMGLAVVHGIVKNCKGDISVTSEPGKGACFHVIFPTINPIETKEAVSQAALPRGTEKILFIDDEPAQADLAMKILPPLGYQVTAMTDSEAALKRFKESPRSFDIVVTDMYMPKLTGKSLATEMLNIRPELPIILCSGYSIDLVSPASLGDYFKGHLIKPFLLKEMAEMIRNVLDQL